MLMTEVKLFLLVVGTLQIAVAQLTCGGGQSCSGPLCPNTIVQYMCNISVPLTFTRWTIPVQQCGGVNTTFLLLPQTVQSSCGISSMQCGSFQASNIPPIGDIPCTSSILSVNITSNLNGTSIICYNSDTNTQYLIGSATILVQSAPGAPSVSVTAKLNELVLGCSYGDEAVKCNVTIEINGTVVSIAANATFYGLVSNTLYPISARAINRCGDYSETSTSHWTLPEAPPTATIKVLQSFFNQSASQLNISWIHVGGNVSHYIIKSVSGMNMFISEASVQGSCVGVSCMYRQIVQTTGSYYTVTISSVNDGGVGPESDPAQGQLASSFKPSFAVTIGVAIGVGVGIPLLLIVTYVTLAFVFVACRIKKITRLTLNKEAKNDGIELSEVQTLESSPKWNRAKHEDTLQKEVNGTSCSPKDTELGSHESFDLVSGISDCNSGGQLSASENKGSVQNASDKSAKVLPEHNGIVPPPKQLSETKNEVGNKQHVLHKRAPQYIRNPTDGTVVTICDDVLMFTSPSYVPDDTQLWYLDDQPDGSFMIVSKMNRRVLACDSESEIKISIQERRGAEGQKWLFEETRIVSLKYHTVMCVRKPEKCLIYVRLKKMTHFDELCCLQPASMVPMSIRVSDDKDGSVLEIKDDEGLIRNAVMDSTHYSQHWYILPHHDNEAEEVFVIASWNSQKALQWDGRVLMVKPYDHEDEAQQWTMNKESFIVPRRNKHTMKLKAHTVVTSYFCIKYLSSYLTCDHIRKKVILSNIEDRTMPLDKHLWMLDMQPDGTFKVISCVNKLELQCDEDNGLFLSSSNSDGYQLWRKEGNYIISEKSHGYIGIDDHDDTLLSIHTQCSKVTGDVWRWKHTCAVKKVLVNVSQIIHQDTGFVLTAPTESSSTEEAKEGSEVTLSPINSLPHHTQHWLLDHKIDGTFVIISDSINRLVISCNHSAGLATKLIMSRFTGEDNQLWRCDGSYIESVKFEGHVISCTSNSQCGLTLCAKGLSNISQYFNNKPVMPVYIKNLQYGSVLELTDKGEVQCKPLDGPRSEYQQWYIKYVTGYGGTVFMIISKKNGKALQKSGDEVKTSECNDQDVSQLWRRDGLYILPQEQTIPGILKVLSVENKSTHLVIKYEYKGLPLTYKPEKWISCFEIQHIIAESYF